MLKQKNISISLLLATFAVVLAACSSVEVRDDSGNSLVGASDVYTLVNLHPDESNSRLYTVNYQMPGLIPVCSKVRITDTGRKAVVFEVVETGREYQYLLHRSLPEPFSDHISDVFGSDCPRDKIAGMSKIDQEGIRDGVAKVGMSKEAVAIAMGPPPSHATPSLESDEWMYWQNRFNRLRVEFENGKVSAVVN